MSNSLAALTLSALSTPLQRRVRKQLAADPTLSLSSVDVLAGLLRAIGERGSIDARKLEHAVQQALIQERRCRELGIQVVAAGDPAFPFQLREAPIRPFLLFAQGDISFLTPPSIAVAGNRKASDWAVQSAFALGRSLAERGRPVVSGLAFGVDTAAHQGCLDAGGKTAAVLAHGLDRIYPAANRELAAAIVERGGCLLSEYPPGEPPRPRRFVERDRIQSGLSAALIVVETSSDGGSMHTARFAKAQGRPVACLMQRQADAENASGNIELVERNGARAIRSGAELDAFLESTARP
jgi:DNA processing protein